VAGLLEKLDDAGCRGDQVIVDPGATGPQEVYKLMVGVIVPRPIAFVSSVSADGVPNLAPFSFFTGISANPPVICFSPMIRGSDGAKKDTLRNIEETREFVVNIVSEEFAQQMNICSAEFPPDVDEFVASGLTPIRSDLVKAPRVKESSVNMECRLLQVVHVSEKPLGGSIVLGEVVRFHIADEICDDYKIDPDKLHPIGRMGGPTYTRTTDRFDMQRPKY
jgi:flavin reductase (DIM6/NTAB) family NADH-FMN oxidoreductase RutF